MNMKEQTLRERLERRTSARRTLLLLLLATTSVAAGLVWVVARAARVWAGCVRAARSSGVHTAPTRYDCFRRKSSKRVRRRCTCFRHRRRRRCGLVDRHCRRYLHHHHHYGTKKHFAPVSAPPHPTPHMTTCRTWCLSAFDVAVEFGTDVAHGSQMDRIWQIVV